MKGISQKEIEEMMKILTNSVIMAKSAFISLTFATKLASRKLKKLGISIDRTKKNN